MANNRLCVVVSAFNEEKNLPGCLESVRSIASEIIVVDNTSGDKTSDIAKKYQAKVFARTNNIMLNINKNFGFEKATSEYILNLDADERVGDQLSSEIRKLLESDPDTLLEGYWIARKNMIFGKWIKSDMWWPDYQLRLFRKGKGRFPEKHVHEYLEVIGETKRLANAMVHENYSSVNQYLHKLESIYSENEATSLISSGYKLDYLDAIRLPVKDFLKTFFLQKGYVDGLHGLVLSLFQAFYTLIVFAKVWEKQGFAEIHPDNFLKRLLKEFYSTGLQVQYWFYTVLIDSSTNKVKKFYYKVRRKKISNSLRKRL